MYEDFVLNKMNGPALMADYNNRMKIGQLTMDEVTSGQPGFMASPEFAKYMDNKKAVKSQGVVQPKPLGLVEQAMQAREKQREGLRGFGIVR